MVACLLRCSFATALAEDAAVVVVAAVVAVVVVAVVVAVEAAAAKLQSWTVAYPFVVVGAACLAVCLCCYPWDY